MRERASAISRSWIHSLSGNCEQPCRFWSSLQKWKKTDLASMQKAHRCETPLPSLRCPSSHAGDRHGPEPLWCCSWHISQSSTGAITRVAIGQDIQARDWITESGLNLCCPCSRSSGPPYQRLLSCTTARRTTQFMSLDHPKSSLKAGQDLIFASLANSWSAGW